MLAINTLFNIGLPCIFGGIAGILIWYWTKNNL